MFLYFIFQRYEKFPSLVAKPNIVYSSSAIAISMFITIISLCYDLLDFEQQIFEAAFYSDIARFSLKHIYTSII